MSVDDGKIQQITYEKGQLMKPCLTGCLLNFHTHPADYNSLYPDHPSSTDFKYIHTATCKFSELSAHLICTPMYLYVIYYKCQNPINQMWDVFTINSRIQRSFNSLSSKHDRSTEAFRQEYIKQMEEIGFSVQRFTWNDNIAFRVPQFRSGIMKKIILIFSVVLLFFLIKKYML